MKKTIRIFLSALLAPLPLPQHPTYHFPGLHLRWRKGWVKGMALRPYWKLRALAGLGPRIQIGKRFSLLGKLQLSGPGTVIFGDDVIVDAHATPFTHSKNAMIEIGARTFVNGTRFGCAVRIEVGSDCILADARIMDTDFHALHKNRNFHGSVAAEKPVIIGKNVWVASNVGILKGVTIGADSVIAYGAVLTKSVPAGRIFGGNPAQDLGSV
jgi:acetyltransferase-like isoleucine patch superfamily enzyme